MDLHREIIAESPRLCRRFGVKRLGLFGSVARGDESEGSDIDFIAEFDDPNPETMPDRYFGFIEESGRQFGRKIQVLTPRMIRNPFLKRAIEKDLLIIYERSVAKTLF